MKLVIFQFLRYTWVGLLNTTLGLGVIWVLMLAGVGPYVSNLAGYTTGLVLSFFINRAWTFEAQRTGWPVGRFFISFMIAYGANLAILTVGLQIAPESAYALQIYGIGTYSVLFFALCKFFVFHRAGTASE